LYNFTPPEVQLSTATQQKLGMLAGLAQLFRLFEPFAEPKKTENPLIINIAVENGPFI
jgi:hypothetical protein